MTPRLLSALLLPLAAFLPCASPAAAPAAPAATASPAAIADTAEMERASREVAASLPAGYTRLGRLQTSDARRIGFSLLGIGGETIDRDYSDFEAWKDYLGPLGAKWVRLQSGWAKTEKAPGRYDFAWLDRVVDGCLERGVQPWLQFSYGNTIYPEGGGVGLLGGMVRGAEALAAWDRYVRTAVRRYRDRIAVYEVWNEADGRGNKAQPGEYARLYERTAAIVREEHPRALVLGLALAHVEGGASGAVTDFIETLSRSGSLGLVGGVTVHGYPRNPDDGFAELAEIRAYLDRHAPGIVLWQGETGASAIPGAPRAPFPVSWGIEWTELSQAKWNLRRALAHIARDMPYSQFAITDVHYTQSNLKGPCPLGLLESRTDLSIAKARIAYFAYRHACTLFSDGCRSAAEGFVWDSPHKTLGAARFYDPHRGRHCAAFWDNRDVPSNTYAPKPVRIAVQALRLAQPVLVDLLTGQVFSIPEGSLRRQGQSIAVTDFPLWDSPRLLCDATLVPFR